MLTSSYCFFFLNILQFSWLLDSQPIVEVSSLHRYAIDQYVDSAGDVISHLNITHVRTDDGGLYKCIASNSMGSIEHAARLNVYGKSINFGCKYILGYRFEPTTLDFFLLPNCLHFNSLCSTCAWRAYTFGLRRSWMWMHSLRSNKLHDEIDRSERIWCYLRAMALSSQARTFFSLCLVWQICANAMMPSRLRCKRCVQNWCWRKRSDIIYVYSGGHMYVILCPDYVCLFSVHSAAALSRNRHCLSVYRTIIILSRDAKGH